MTHRIEVTGELARRPATRLKRPLLAELVFALDRGLQRLQGIFEYTHKRDCFFRIRFNRLRTEVVLSDGTVGRRGDRVVELHLWNERIPALPAKIIRANMSLGSKAQSDSLYGIVSRHGFEVFPDEVALSLPSARAGSARTFCIGC